MESKLVVVLVLVLVQGLAQMLGAGYSSAGAAEAGIPHIGRRAAP